MGSNLVSFAVIRRSRLWACDELKPAIFNLFHLMACINQLLKFYGAPKNVYIFIWLSKENEMNAFDRTVRYCMF